jgi:hypothetical protein
MTDMMAKSIISIATPMIATTTGMDVTTKMITAGMPTTVTTIGREVAMKMITAGDNYDSDSDGWGDLSEYDSDQT